MDYSKIKLGLIGKYKVWRERREAKKYRSWRDNIEHEISEVDYSKAEKLEANLLEQKRIKRATRDAAKLYKSVYGKENDGVGESDFIKDYLVEHGLKQKALPKPKTSPRNSFIKKYSTEKSDVDLNVNTKPKVDYRREEDHEIEDK